MVELGERRKWNTFTLDRDQDCKSDSDEDIYRVEDGDGDSDEDIRRVEDGDGDGDKWLHI